jgi:hypothetical protein
LEDLTVDRREIIKIILKKNSTKKTKSMGLRKERAAGFCKHRYELPVYMK